MNRRNIYTTMIMAAALLGAGSLRGQALEGTGPFAIYKLSSTDKFNLFECRDAGTGNPSMPTGPGMPAPKPLNPVSGSILTQEYIIVDVGSETPTESELMIPELTVYDYIQLRIPFYTDFSVNGVPRKLYNVPSMPSEQPLTVQFVRGTAANSFQTLVKENLMQMSDGEPTEPTGFEGGGQFATGIATPFKLNLTETMNLIPRTLAGEWRHYSFGGMPPESSSFYTETGAPKVTFESALTLEAYNGVKNTVIKSFDNPYSEQDGDTLTPGTLSYAVQLIINALSKLGYDQDPDVFYLEP